MGQRSLPDDKSSLPLHVETHQAALSLDASSRWSSRSLWTGLGLVVVMLIGISACASHSPAPKASADASRLVPAAAAFFNYMPPALRPRVHLGSHRAAPATFSSIVSAGPRPAVLPVMGQQSEANLDIMVDAETRKSISDSLAKSHEDLLQQLQKDDGETRKSISDYLAKSQEDLLQRLQEEDDTTDEGLAATIARSGNPGSPTLAESKEDLVPLREGDDNSDKRDDGLRGHDSYESSEKGVDTLSGRLSSGWRLRAGPRVHLDRNWLLNKPSYEWNDFTTEPSNTEKNDMQKTKVDERSTDEQLQFDKVLGELKNGFMQIFRKEPDWNMFADGFTLIEPTGDVVEGLGPVKITLGFLRKIRNLVPVNADVDVTFSAREGDGMFNMRQCSGEDCVVPEETIIDARWKVTIDLELPNAPSESVVEVESKIHLNDDNKVDYIQIDNWIVTGDLLKAWPSFRQTPRLGQLQTRNELRDRAIDLKQTSARTFTSSPKAAGDLVKAASSLAGDFISSELQYLSTLFVQAGILGGVSDAISQTIDGVPVNGAHVVAMALSASVLGGIFDTIWLQTIEREVPGTNIAAVLTKTVADFVIAGSLVNSAYLLGVPILTAALSGMPLPHPLFEGWTLDQFSSAMRTEAFTYTPYDLFAFRLIPPEFRPITMAVVSAINTIILSGITRQV